MNGGADDAGRRRVNRRRISFSPKDQTTSIMTKKTFRNRSTAQLTRYHFNHPRSIAY